MHYICVSSKKFKLAQKNSLVWKAFTCKNVDIPVAIKVYHYDEKERLIHNSYMELVSLICGGAMLVVVSNCKLKIYYSGNFPFSILMRKIL